MALGRTLLNKHGLSDWTFDVRNLSHAYFNVVNVDGGDLAQYIEGSEMGVCFRKSKTILLNWHAPQWTARQTILHEIAHALTPDDNDHGSQWQDKAREVGCTSAHVLLYILRELDAQRAVGEPDAPISR